MPAPMIATSTVGGECSPIFCTGSQILTVWLSACQASYCGGSRNATSPRRAGGPRQKGGCRRVSTPRACGRAGRDRRASRRTGARARSPLCRSRRSARSGGGSERPHPATPCSRAGRSRARRRARASCRAAPSPAGWRPHLDRALVHDVVDPALHDEDGCTSTATAKRPRISSVTSPPTPWFRKSIRG